MSATAMAKLVIEVQAGVILGEPDPELTKRWAMTSEEWEAAEKAGPHQATTLLATRMGEAQGYAGLLGLQPNRFNWVRLDWVWL